jgi:hypothetical protein
MHFKLTCAVLLNVLRIVVIVRNRHVAHRFDSRTNNQVTVISASSVVIVSVVRGRRYRRLR